jgi:DNA-binding NarL/FixJ family response regulator
MPSPGPRIPVHVSAADPITEAGLAAALRPRPEVDLVAADDINNKTVGVIAADSVDEDTLKLLKEIKRRGCERMVLVTVNLDDNDLLAAVEAGVCGLVRRSEATPSRLAQLISTAASGDGALPPDVLGRLLKQVSRLQRQVLSPRGLSFTGLSAREVEVLRLVARGCDTREIAAQLCYSERTVKNVLHDITSRYQLKNRSHAVAYALREGLI